MGIQFTVDQSQVTHARGHLAAWRGTNLGRIMDGAAKEGALIFKAPLRAAAPGRRLRSSIKLRRDTRAAKGYAAWAVGPSGRKVWFRQIVVSGSRAHDIPAKNKEVVASKSWEHPVRVAHNPGAKANPFVARVGESYHAESVARMNAYIKEVSARGGRP